MVCASPKRRLGVPKRPLVRTGTICIIHLEGVTLLLAWIETRMLTLMMKKLGCPGICLLVYLMKSFEKRSRKLKPGQI